MSSTGQKSLQIMSRAQWYNRWLFSWLEPYLGSSVLEIGSGVGNFTSMLLGKGRKVIATDVEQEYLQKIKSRIKNQNLRITYGDIEKNEFTGGPGKVDSVVCMNVLEHIKDDKKALRNMNELLKKRGTFILLVPAHQIAFGKLDVNLGHVRRYNKGLVSKRLKQAGFKVRGIRYLNALGVLGWFVNARIFKRHIISKNQLIIFDLISRPLLFLEKFVEPPFGLSVLAIAEKK